LQRRILGGSFKNPISIAFQSGPLAKRGEMYSFASQLY
jgi:hypothetical protein